MYNYSSRKKGSEVKRILLIILLALVIDKGMAQQIPFDNQYLVNKYSLSSAYAGYTDNMELFVGARQSWIGIPGAPNKQNININTPFLKKGLGLGLNLTNETSGNFSNFVFQPAIAYHLQLADNMSLHFGINGEIYRNQYNFSEAQSETIDPFVSNYQALKGSTFNVGAGFVFQYLGLNLGVNVPRALNSKLIYNTETPNNNFTLVRHYQAFLSYHQKVKEKWIIEPSVVVRSTEKSPLLYEGQFMVNYSKRVWAALGYRKGNELLISAGAALSGNIILNYSYEFASQGIVNYSAGTHEIRLGFLLKKSTKKKPLPSIFKGSAVNSSGIGRDTILQRQVNVLEQKLKKMETQLAANSTSCDCDDLDRRIKKLEGNLDKLDAETWEKPFIIRNIKFGNNSSKLFASSFPELRKLAQKMKVNPDLMLKITGYTDNAGSPSYNLRLSKKRAEAVKAFLVRNGISAERILTEGKGEANPVADNKTPTGRAQNRRIEGQFKEVK